MFISSRLLLTCCIPTHTPALCIIIQFIITPFCSEFSSISLSQRLKIDPLFSSHCRLYSCSETCFSQTTNPSSCSHAATGTLLQPRPNHAPPCLLLHQLPISLPHGHVAFLCSLLLQLLLQLLLRLRPSLAGSLLPPSPRYPSPSPLSRHFPSIPTSFQPHFLFLFPTHRTIPSPPKIPH